MCHPASFVLTKDSIFYSEHSDSHEDIIKEFGLNPDGVRGPNVVRVEISPENNKFDLPLRKWVFKVDQDILPDWWIQQKGERRTRIALKSWAEKKLVLPKDDGKTIQKGNVIIYNSSACLYNNSSAKLYGDSSADLFNNSSAELCNNSSAYLYNNSFAVLCDNSSAELYNNSSAKLYGNSSAKLYGNSSAKLHDNSFAELCNNSSANLYNNSSAVLCDNSSAELYNNSSAELKSVFAVYWNHHTLFHGGGRKIQKISPEN